MKDAGLCGRQKGRYRVQTTDSNHDHPIAPNRFRTHNQRTKYSDFAVHFFGTSPGAGFRHTAVLAFEPAARLGAKGRLPKGSSRSVEAGR